MSTAQTKARTSKKGRNKFYLLLVIIAAIILFLFVQLNWLQVTDEDIYLSKLPAEFEDFRILHLSDLHSKSFGKDSKFLVRKIKGIDPDIIVMTGDMRTNNRDDDGEVLITLLRELDGHYPIYYITGGHEEAKYYTDSSKYGITGTKVAYEQRLADFGVIVLNDEKTKVMRGEASINIYGLKDKSSGEMFIGNRLEEPSSEEVNILLNHTPDVFTDFVNWGADLILVGHTHGGIIRIPFVGGLISTDLGSFFPEYDAGRFEKDGSTMIISRGLGNHTVHIRVFNRPEMVVVTLKNGE